MTRRETGKPETAKQEGVIKFQLDYTPTSPLDASLLTELMHWRDLLFEHQLIGQDPTRYGGYGFGNISARLPSLETTADQRIFAISGTQTGNLPHLGAEHYALVEACYPAENRIVASGPIRPSSESMTHGVLYELDADLRFVMHAHSPEIWLAASRLGLPITQADIPYGTPEMAQEVHRLFTATDCRQRGIFSMGGHEDGIVSFGPTADSAGTTLLDALRRAREE
jgi:L-ribulose-5-phosphate 4-epimerase